jgi:protein TonB
MIAKKKAPKADLERKRFAFFQIGLILAGSICLAAFEFVTPVFGKVDKQLVDQENVLEMPEIPVELMASSQPKTKQIQTNSNEVKLVVKLSPKIVKSEPAKNINMKFPDFLTSYGNDSVGPVVQTVDIISDDPEKWPEFPGNMGEWIGKHMKLPDYVYPISGTVYVNFVVSKTGEITNVKISKSLDPEHDRAALEVVKKMPNWTPGEQFGKPVAVNYHLPIRIVNK